MQLSSTWTQKEHSEEYPGLRMSKLQLHVLSKEIASDLESRDNIRRVGRFYYRALTPEKTYAQDRRIHWRDFVQEMWLARRNYRVLDRRMRTPRLGMNWNPSIFEKGFPIPKDNFSWNFEVHEVYRSFWRCLGVSDHQPIEEEKEPQISTTNLPILSLLTPNTHEPPIQYFIYSLKY